MRKILLLTILFLTAVCVDAQTLVGFQGYYTKAKLSTDTTKLNRMQTYESGYGGGISVKHFELGPLGLQAELNYEKSGFGFRNDTTNENNPMVVNYRQDLTYVQLATLMQLDIGKHTVHLVGAIGPYLNVLIAAPEPETDMETVMKNGFSKMYTSDFNRFTYGLVGEAGFAIATKVGVFQVTGRASIGMSKLLAFHGVSLFNYTLPKSYGVGVSYLVPFGEEKYKQDKPAKDTIVSDLEILSDSLNAAAASDSLGAKSAKDSAKKDKKQKDKKDKKNKNAEPEIAQPDAEQPVGNKPDYGFPEIDDSELEIIDDQEEEFIDDTETSDNDTEPTDNGTE